MRSKFFILFLSFALFSFKHPFYLGVTELKYSEKEKTMQVTVKLFTNDLEDALGKLHSKKPDLINGKDKKALDKILSDYITQQLLLKINGRPFSMSFLGFEHENDAVWMFLEIPDCPLPKNLEIENRLLYDLLKNQTNIIHCEVKGEKKSTKLSFPDKSAVFTF